MKAHKQRPWERSGGDWLPNCPLPGEVQAALPAGRMKACALTNTHRPLVWESVSAAYPGFSSED